MHPLNSLLSEPEKVHIVEDELHSRKYIESTVAEIDRTIAASETVNGAVVAKLLRAVGSHQSLKYELTADNRCIIVKILMKLYETGTLSVPLKLRVLKSMKGLCRKTDPRMKDFSFSWKPFWEELLLIISRDDRHEAKMCEQHVLGLMVGLVDFLHGSRHYVTHGINDSSETSGFGEIVDTAMARLVDTRYPVCVEGVLLLLNCLPTDYPKYDEVLPLWIAKWAEINQNAYWDSCWLTLFTRARKYTKTFDWTTLSPFLLTKTKELMQLPIAESGNNAQNLGDFPHTFPGYYTKLIVSHVDQRKCALNKMAKLIYHLTLCDPTLVPAELITVSPPVDTTEDNGSNKVVLLSGFNYVPTTEAGKLVNRSAVDVVLFLQSIRTYFYPSNTGSYTPQLAYFLATFIFQLCRHVGKGVANQLIGNKIDTDNGVWEHFYRPVHLATIKYINGSVLSLLLEGLYNKNQVMTQFASSCLKNMVTVDPSIGDVFIPFLLTALDPAAVTQSHQAPVAMQTISLCFKSLLYPSPVILKYLPDILRLSLPGIDASDAGKTGVTLNMYSNILAWLPISESYKLPTSVTTPVGGAGVGGVSSDVVFPPSYFTLLATAEGDKHMDATRVTSEEYQSQWDVLSAYIATEWAPALLEKLFSLLDSQEMKVKGTRDNPVIASLGQCAGYLFQSISPVTDAPLRKTVETKLLDYFVKTTPANASKGCAKMMESMTSTNPVILPEILKAILTSDIVAGTCSTDKLAYRIYLAAGACRAAYGVNIIRALPILESVLTSKTLIHHSEKSVRQAVGKLLKDSLKGMTAFYPTVISPLFGNNAVFGAPNIPQGQVDWHVPSSDVLTEACKVLYATLTRSMDEISATLAEIQSGATVITTAVIVPTDGAVSEKKETSSAGGSGSGSGGGSNLKKVEELLSNNLHIIERALRGAAEVLGDDGLITPESAAAAAVVKDSTSEGEGEMHHLLSTGRSVVLTALQTTNPEAAVYLKSLRATVLTFLSALHSGLEAIPSESPFASLKNNTLMLPQWSKVYTLVVTRRTACLKDTENIRKWLKYSKHTSRTSISKIVYKAIRAAEMNNVVSESAVTVGGGTGELSPYWSTVLRTKEYWQYHDQSTNTIVCSVWLQHAIRNQEFSFAAVKASVPAKNNRDNLYILALHNLLSLCEHEYDAVRSSATKAFEKVYSRFGYRVVHVIKSLMQTIVTPGSTYYQTSAALSLLKMKSIRKRILSEWELTELFLSAVSASQNVISTVTEVDKREKLMFLLTELFVKYLGNWSHLLLSNDQSTVNVIKNALANVGYHHTPVSESFVAMEVSVSGSGCDSNNATESAAATGVISSVNNTAAAGLRYETFAAYILLHFVGHPKVEISSNLWQWAIDSLCNAHGQPTQMIGLSAVVRLSQLANVNRDFKTTAYGTAVRALLAPNNNNSNNSGDDSSSEANTALWKSILHGVSQCHPKSEEGASAQWSQGIDHILRGSEFLKIVLNRDITCILSDKNLFSNYFRKEDAGLYYSLALSGLLDSASGIIFSVESLCALFAVSKTLPSTSESEARSNNATRSELFSGLLRAYHVASADPNNTNNNINTADSLEVQKVFLSFLLESIEKLSVDFMRDWAEAVYFAFNCKVNNVNDVIPAYILDAFRQLLRSQYDASAAVRASASTTSAIVEAGSTSSAGATAEGFAEQGKVLLLTKALLQADLSVGTATVSEVANSIYSAVNDPNSNIVSPYRTSRIEIASILSILIELSPVPLDTASLRSRLTIACASVKYASTGTTAGSSTTVSTAVNSTENSERNSPVPSGMDVVSDPTAGTVDALVTDTGVDESTTASTKSVNSAVKNAAETACIWLQFLMQRVPIKGFSAEISDLLNIAILSTSSGDLELVKLAHDTAIYVIRAVMSAHDILAVFPASQTEMNKNNDTGTNTQTMVVSSNESALIQSLLSSLDAHSQHGSWRVRETTMKCLSILMANNWPSLTANQRKICKDIYARGINDTKPEVTHIAKAGMVAYLAYKTGRELRTIADAYIKNSDIFATREKKKRKLHKDSTTASTGGGVYSEKPDTQYSTTITMMCCLVLSSPYDLPSYLPALLTSLVRHITNTTLKDTIAKTVQMFKMSHQDRWESDFKHKFTREQLEDLQGAGAASYFS